MSNPLAIAIAVSGSGVSGDTAHGQIPVLDHYVYPFLQRKGIAFGPLKRVVAGFVLAGIAMAWCALIQQLVCAWHR